MNCHIFIVSFKPHFNYLNYALRSIDKFARGFAGVTVLVPNEDLEELKRLISSCSGESGIPFTAVSGEEWPGKGMNWHQAQIMRSDEWIPNAEFILHTDSDCIFTEPVTPEDYFVDGKPVLLYASYEYLCKDYPTLRCWQTAAQFAVGFHIQNEFMRRHPAVHYRAVYAKSRDLIERHHAKSMDAYIQKQKNEFPQGFAEFPTLGAVAWRSFHDRYHWINTQNHPHPPDKIRQAWSHREVTKEDMEVFVKLGLAEEPAPKPQ